MSAREQSDETEKETKIQTKRPSATEDRNIDRYREVEVYSARGEALEIRDTLKVSRRARCGIFVSAI